MSGAANKHHEISESTGIEIDNNQTNQASLPSRRRVESFCETYKWPGVPAILESYKRHSEEQKRDKKSLLFGNKRQHKDLEVIQREATALESDLAQALVEQQSCEEEVRSVQRSVDILKNCIQMLTAKPDVNQ